MSEVAVIDSPQLITPKPNGLTYQDWSGFHLADKSLTLRENRSAFGMKLANGKLEHLGLAFATSDSVDQAVRKVGHTAQNTGYKLLKILQNFKHIFCPCGRPLNHRGLCRPRLAHRGIAIERLTGLRSAFRGQRCQLFCIHGHPLTGANVYTNPHSRKMQRVCLQCRVATERERARRRIQTSRNAP